MSIHTKPNDSIDMRVFVPSISIIIGLILPILLFPEAGPKMVSAAFSFATGNFGWLYMIAGLAVVVFLIGLAFSKYGNVRLGSADDKPEFSYFTGG